MRFEQNTFFYQNKILYYQSSIIKVYFFRKQLTMAKKEQKKYSPHCLYVKFTNSLNKDINILKDQLQKMCPLITDIRRPRQPNARFCFVHFHSEQDLLKGKEILEGIKIFNQHLIIRVPLDPDSEFIKQKKQKIEERRQAKRALKALNKKVKKSK